MSVELVEGKVVPRLYLRHSTSKEQFSTSQLGWTVGSVAERERHKTGRSSCVRGPAAPDTDLEYGLRRIVVCSEKKNCT